MRGGGQERGLRGGTENVIGLAGLGAACGPAAARVADETRRLEHWRDTIETMVRGSAPDVTIFGERAGRLPNTTCFAAAGYDARVVLMNLDLAGVAVSAGSACTAGKVKPSHVLEAMRVPADLATSAVRVSLGWTTTQADVDHFCEAFATAMRTMRRPIAA